MRRLFWSEDFEEWCRRQSKLPPLSASRASFGEQINQAFADFIAGRPLTGMTKCDPPRGQALWRLKTPDLRLYEWADEPQCMILVAGELKQTLALPGFPKDRDMGKQVVAARRSMGFDDWKYGEIFDVFPKCSD
jgi:hypothetical protein